MILSEPGLGAIYAGSTLLAFNCTLEQTGDAELTVSAGLLTLTDGVAFEFPLTEIAFQDGLFYLLFGLLPDGSYKFQAVPTFGSSYFTPIQMVAGFGAGIEVKAGAIVGDVYVLTVLPGFPDGVEYAAAEPLPDWNGLVMALRGSDLFLVAFSTTNQNAWSLLLATLNSNSASDDAGRLHDFKFAIAQIRMGLAVDYTPSQLARFNALLMDCHFPVQV